MLSSLLYLMTFNICLSQENTMSLWSGKNPNQQKTDEVEIHENTNMLRISYVQEPSLEVYLSAKQNATGKAMAWPLERVTYRHGQIDWLIGWEV